MLTDTRNSAKAIVCGSDYRDVKWADGFWGDVTERVSVNTVPHLQKMFEDASVSHVVENFRIAAGEKQGDFEGTVFGDGDFYKWMEAAMYAAIQNDDRNLLGQLDSYIDLIGRAQQKDGYLSTKQIIESRAGENSRMKDVNEFEVYNMGHLFTAACLYKRLTGNSRFLEIAERAAAYLEEMYSRAEATGLVQTAVCPSHYMGLIELYRTTGRERYLNLARKVIQLRDLVKEGSDDNQDRIPLKSHRKIVGHAVRASYLYAGVSDLLAEEDDDDYQLVLDSVWKNMMSTKIYLTGGIGALYNGVSPYGNFFVDAKIHQAFGYEYQLPNVTAYNETCASVGLVMWAYRMFLSHPKAEYFDAIERAMLNVNLGAVSLDGKKFFYENMLRREKKLEYELVWPLTRSAYILSYCCPPNLARVLMQSSEYAFAIGDGKIYTGLYGACNAALTMRDGSGIKITEETGYPYDGNICFKIEPENDVDFCIRIPGWCDCADITVNTGGDSRSQRVVRQSGAMFESGTYESIFLPGEQETVITLNLRMKPRFTIANPTVEEDEGLIAVEYGSLVYCMESADADVERLSDIVLDTSEEFQPASITIEGIGICTLEGRAFAIERDEWDSGALYQTLRPVHRKAVNVRMIPYFAWDNRGMGEMRIWFPYLQK